MSAFHDITQRVGRPFGSAEDLDVDFATDDRPALVTAILASCSEPQDEEFWWSQPVGARIAELLRVIGATDATDHLGLKARCAQPSCAEWFEFELSLAELNNALVDAPNVRVTLEGGRSVALRRPNGADLREWRGKGLESREGAIAAMLRSLVVEGEATSRDEAVLARALERLDPLVGLTVSCVCPVCRSPNEVSVDLEDIALTRLKQRQRVLLREIHELASRYGWTEAEVLAVPPRRRAYYLALIEDE